MALVPEIEGGEEEVKSEESSKRAGVSRFPKMALLRLLPIFFLLVCLIPETVRAEYTLGYNPQRVFRLDGDVTLIYERDWTSSSTILSYFTYYTDLTLSGFVVDPRIMTFQVGGNFGQTFQSPGGTVNAYGFSLNTQFLNERPKKGFLRFLPQPIELRYYFGKTTDTQTQNYGISLQYSLGQLIRPKVAPVSQQTLSNNTSNVGEEAPRQVAPGYFAWPNLYLDYDRYSYKFLDHSTNNDRLSLRAQALSTHAEYYADYEDYAYRNGQKATFRTLDLEATYHFYNKDKTSTLDWFNRLLVGETKGDIEGNRQLSFTSAAVWVQHLGPMWKDSLVVNGGGRYFTASNTSSTYELNLAAAYNKFFSERFSNYASLGLGYGKDQDQTTHAETLSNQLTYAIAPYLTFNNTLTAGNTQDGPLYGASVGLNAYSQRVSASMTYQFSYQDVLTGNTKWHRVSLDLTGSLFQNMTFYSQNYYRISDVEDMVSPFQEKDLYLSASIMWRIFRSTLSLGASTLRVRTEQRGSSMLSVTGGVAHPVIETGITTYNATLTTLLARRLTFNIFAYYQQEKDGPDSLFVTPMLLWYYRKMTLDAEYTLRMTKRQGTNFTEHRVYLRLTRLIDNNLRPFW